MFQFTWFPPSSYVFTAGCPDITRNELPHSGIPGSKPVCGSPEHFAAHRALLRPFAPRHPPFALCSLTKISNYTYSFTPSEDSYILISMQLPMSNQIRCPRQEPRQASDPDAQDVRSGLRFAAETMSAAQNFYVVSMEASGFEPLTFAVQRRRSPN